MKIKDLIQILSNYDESLEVCWHHSDDTFHTVDEESIQTLTHREPSLELKFVCLNWTYVLSKEPHAKDGHMFWQEDENDRVDKV